MVRLDEEATKIVHRGELFLIIQKVTFKSARFYGKEYDCVIVGDGKIQHYGIEFEEFEPATI